MNKLFVWLEIEHDTDDHGNFAPILHSSKICNADDYLIALERMAARKGLSVHRVLDSLTELKIELFIAGISSRDIADKEKGYVEDTRLFEPIRYFFTTFQNFRYWKKTNQIRLHQTYQKL